MLLHWFIIDFLRELRSNTQFYKFFRSWVSNVIFASYELQWLLYLIQDLRVQCSKPHVLYCDNQSAIHIVTNLFFHERTKHLEIDCHFLREKILQDLFKLLSVKSQDQLVDLFVKHLPPKNFNHSYSSLPCLTSTMLSFKEGVKVNEDWTLHYKLMTLFIMHSTIVKHVPYVKELLLITDLVTKLSR